MSAANLPVIVGAGQYVNRSRDLADAGGAPGEMGTEGGAPRGTHSPGIPPPNHRVIPGAGQSVTRPRDLADAVEPLEMMATVARATVAIISSGSTASARSRGRVTDWPAPGMTRWLGGGMPGE